MHDLGVRVFSILLLSGVLMFVAFFLLSILYPRRAAAASPAGNSHTVTVRSKDHGISLRSRVRWNGRCAESSRE